jgi:hypothetical protein
MKEKKWFIYHWGFFRILFLNGQPSKQDYFAYTNKLTEAYHKQKPKLN